MVEVSTGYNASDTSIVLKTGEGVKLSDPDINSYNLVWFNSTDYASPDLDPNVEIIKVTDIVTDTLTIVRPVIGNNYLDEGDENIARDHNIAGKQYKMLMAVTKSLLDRIAGDYLATVSHDASLTGDGTLDDPLSVAGNIRKSNTFTDNDTSQTFTDANVTATSIIEVYAQATPAGGWTVVASDGEFTITSTKAESTDIPFIYYIRNT